MLLQRADAVCSDRTHILHFETNMSHSFCWQLLHGGCLANSTDWPVGLTSLGDADEAPSHAAWVLQRTTLSWVMLHALHSVLDSNPVNKISAGLTRLPGCHCISCLPAVCRGMYLHLNFSRKDVGITDWYTFSWWKPRMSRYAPGE